jgi:hypothetical protein
MKEFDIVGPRDKPALLAISTPEALATVKTALDAMGYKVHSVESRAQFELRFNQTNYHLVFIEESFAGANLHDNPTLRLVQNLPMALRRHAVFFLVGAGMETLNVMQAFVQSVHCVIHYSELGMLQELVTKTVAENDSFLSTYRDIQRRAHQKPA